MSRYNLTRRADRDLDAIWNVIHANNGSTVADRIERELHDAMRLLADNPLIGHIRADVRNPRYRFWTVYNFVIAYYPAEKPLVIARVVHGARNFKSLFG
jgi:plasmid stabilization system protein ParE